ncbi:MAG: VanZ family protein [Candidatus Firestonebacteria bacterium]
MRFSKRFFYWLPVFVILAGIFYISSKSEFPGGQILNIPFLDKIAHLFVYFLLSWFIFRALHYSENVRIKKAIFIAIIFSAIYGITDELHQYFVPLRDCSVFDWVFDCIGAILPFVKDFISIK